MTYSELKEKLSFYVKPKATENTVLRHLDGFYNTCYYKVDKESNYFNCKVYLYDTEEKGYIRIYKSSKGMQMQIWSPCEMKYSGIPTFFGSGL